MLVTPVGGQGFVLGRGNQQLSCRPCCAPPGAANLVVLATEAKLAALRGGPLLVDTGDPARRRGARRLRARRHRLRRESCTSWPTNERRMPGSDMHLEFASADAAGQLPGRD